MILSTQNFCKYVLKTIFSILIQSYELTVKKSEAFGNNPQMPKTIG